MSAFIPSLPALTGSAPASPGALPPAPSGEGTLAGIAEHLGMSADGLRSALREGRSIAGLAEQQGIPRESVASFISAHIQRARQYSGQPPLDEDALARMVDRALERGRPAGAPAGGGDAAGVRLGPDGPSRSQGCRACAAHPAERPRG
jgi:hypothetical protein